MNESNKVRKYLVENLQPQLQKEVDAYISMMPRTHKTAWEIITYNEVAMVGLVKSAIIRNKKECEVWALQEYEVFEGNTPKGRADLYVVLNDQGGLKCDLLIEAKKDEKYIPKPSLSKKDKNWEKSLKDTLEQGLRYYEYEKSYFQEKPTYVVTMFFGVFKKEDESCYKSYETPPVHTQAEKDYTTDHATYKFYIEPPGAPEHLCVYGQILKVKPKL